MVRWFVLLLLALVLGAGLGSGRALATDGKCSGLTIPPGTEIQEVVAKNPAGATYCIQPGLYRLTETIAPKTGDKFVGLPGAVLNGSKPITNWVASGPLWMAAGQTQSSQSSWQPDWPPLGNLTAQYNEDVFFDDQQLRPVLSRDQVGPGKFFFDYANTAIYIGDNPAGHKVEGSVVWYAFSSKASGVTVSGFTIEKFTHNGIDLSQNAVIQGNEVRLVHGAGIRFAGGSQVLNNSVHHNGTFGLSGSGANALVEGNEIAFNNTAGYVTTAGGCWAAGGTKFVLTSNLMVRGNYSHNNFCDGLWSDICNINTIYQDNRIENNYRNGLTVEISYAHTIRNNVVSGNFSSGIFINSSPDQDISGNLIFNNGVGQPDNGIVLPASGRGGVLITQQNRPLGSCSQGEVGPHLAQNNTVHDNTIAMIAGSTGANGMPQVFSQNNRFVSNHYTVPDASAAWWAWQNGSVGWAQWQATGQDVNAGLAAVRGRITSAAVVSAASYSSLALSGEAIATAFGSGLASETAIAASTPLPTTLGGATVKVTDSAGVERLAPLFFVSPTQINFQVPSGTTTGPALVVAAAGDSTLIGAAQIASVAPALFTADGSGQGVAAGAVLRVKADGMQSQEPLAQWDPLQKNFIALPIDLGPATDQVFLILFGTGIRFRSSLSAVTAQIGGADATVTFAAAQPQFAGVDQVNVLVPRALAGAGTVDLVLTVAGQRANAVQVSVR